MFVSVTRLRIRSLRFIPSFLSLNSRCTKQVCTSPGFLRGGELVDRGFTFWTLTGWLDERSMKAFRGTGPHAEAMRLLPHWCNEAAIGHWIHETDELPDWEEAHRKLVETGRLSRVEHPNENHQAKRFREPRLSRWRKSKLLPH
jgi:hypothetical protein